MHKENGYIFFTTLVAICIVFLLVSSVDILAQKHLLITRHQNGSQQAFYFAESGIEDFFSRFDEQIVLPEAFDSDVTLGLLEKGNYEVSVGHVIGNLYQVTSRGQYGESQRTLQNYFVLLNDGDIFESNITHEEGIVVIEEPNKSQESGFFDEFYQYKEYEFSLLAPAIINGVSYAFPLPEGGESVIINLAESTQTFAPGDYNFSSMDLNKASLFFEGPANIYVAGDLDMGNDSVIDLAGDVNLYVGGNMISNNSLYDFSGLTNIWIEGDMNNQGSTVLVTADTTRINIKGDMLNQNDTALNAEGSVDNLLLVFETSVNHDLSFFNETNINGGIYAPTGDILMTSSASIEGGVVAEEVIALGSAGVTYSELIGNLTLGDNGDGNSSYDITYWEEQR